MWQSWKSYFLPLFQVLFLLVFLFVVTTTYLINIWTISIKIQLPAVLDY